jgi:HD-GYP domain-containing protein (c-di-GMP phosphodiesterase class II)
MIFTAVEYHKLLEYFRQETYRSLRVGYKLTLILLYFFIVGFIVGAVNTFLRDIDITDAFISLLFFLIALYIFFTLRTQSQMAVMAREKALEAMLTFVNVIDLKEFYSKGHSKHVYDIVNLFYDYLPDYRYVLNKAKLLDAAVLHDIGKINISVELLSKRDKLSPEDWEIIKAHPLRGKEMLDKTCFSEISNWVKYHHERVDGNGYYGLVSEDIPLESKIIAIADAYSALCNDRAYRPRLSHEEAIGLISREAGKHFDRRLTEHFLRIDKEALERL